MKILGMYWPPTDDVFKVELKFHQVKSDVVDGIMYPTKRELFSLVMYKGSTSKFSDTT